MKNLCKKKKKTKRWANEKHKTTMGIVKTTLVSHAVAALLWFLLSSIIVTSKLTWHEIKMLWSFFLPRSAQKFKQDNRFLPVWRQTQPRHWIPSSWHGKEARGQLLETAEVPRDNIEHSPHAWYPTSSGLLKKKRQKRQHQLRSCKNSNTITQTLVQLHFTLRNPSQKNFLARAFRQRCRIVAWRILIVPWWRTRESSR